MNYGPVGHFPSPLSGEQHDLEVLDFTPSAGTPESQVKTLLVSHESGSSVILVIGPGGTGKTTILRAIERDTAVRSRYHHGITFIELGQHITLAGFITKLTRFVEIVADPEWLANFTVLTLSERSQGQAMAALAEHFAHKPMLLILDDVWSADNSVYKLIQDLALEVNKANSSFKLLLSTRFQDIAYTPMAGAGVEVMPHPYFSETAKRILCGHAGLDETALGTLSPGGQNAANAILKNCDGLPLALAVAGRAIRMLGSTEGPEQTLWERCWEHMRKTRSAGVADGTTSHEGLFDAIRSSLTSLQSTWPDYMSMSPHQAVSSFCVFEKQTEIPVDIVASMWDVDPEQAQIVMNMFCDSSILSDMSRMNGKSSTYQMHDHIHDFATAVAESNGAVSLWHHKLVTNYASRLPIHAMKRGDTVVREWWIEELMKDRYMKDNLIRHLTLGRELNEAIRLLVNYRWIQQLNSDEKSVPFHRVLADAKLVHAFLKSREGMVEVVSGDGSVKGLLSDLEYFIEALEAIMPTCATSRDECAFQLHGHICTPDGETSLFDQCLRSIETCANRPWARPMEGMLHKPGPSLKRVLRPNGLVRSMALHPEKDEIVLGCDTTRKSSWKGIEVLDSRSGRRKVAWSPLTNNVEQCLRSMGTTTGFGVISVVVGSEEVAALSGVGIITVWRDLERKREFSPFVSPLRATCMALVGKNSVACGSNAGTIRLLDASSWEIQQDLPRCCDPVAQSTVEEIRERPLSRAIRAICSSRDGNLILSLSDSGLLRRWDRQTGFPYPSMSPHPPGIQCMTISNDGKLMAVGMQNGRVQIFDATSGEQKKILTGHRSTVLSLLFSADGKILYSGGIDMTVQCWDVYRGTRMGRPLRQHNAKIAVLCLSRDGTELYSASQDRICVSRARPRRVANRETGMESGFGSKVQAFCLSHDKKTIVTVETDVIRFRDLRDPITRYEALRQLSSSAETTFASLPIRIEDKIDFVELVAVSYDGKSVAYTVRQRNLLDPDCDKTHIFVAQRRDKHSWGIAQRAPQISSLEFPDLVDASIQSLQFREDDSLEVVFQPQIGHSSKTLLLTWYGNDDFFHWEGDDIGLLYSDLPFSDVPARSAPSKMDLKLGKVVVFDSRKIGTLDVEAMPHRDIRGAVAEKAVVFDENVNRLWILNKESRLQYVDLVKDAPDNNGFPPGPLPEVKVNGDAVPELDTPARAGHDVFISFAGPDKQTIALPLSEILTTQGIKCFVDNSNLKSTTAFTREMVKAIEEAPIGVVITSPEYPARRWTLRQLQCLQRRGSIATETGTQGVTIIPVFYRLEAAKCRNLNLISDVCDVDRSERQKYEELVSEGAAEIWAMRKSMACLGELTGIDNEEGAMNDSAPGMTERRRKLIARVAKVVEEELERMRRLDDNSSPVGTVGAADTVEMVE